MKILGSALALSLATNSFLVFKDAWWKPRQPMGDIVGETTGALCLDASLVKPSTPEAAEQSPGTVDSSAGDAREEQLREKAAALARQEEELRLQRGVQQKAEEQLKQQQEAQQKAEEELRQAREAQAKAEAKRQQEEAERRKREEAQRQSQAPAQEVAGSAPVPDVTASVGQLLQFSEDFARFAFESSVGRLWKRPADARTATSGSDSLGSELLAHVLDVAGASINALGDLLGSACPENINAASMCDVAAAYGRRVADAPRQSFAAWLQGFVQRFPQHGKALAGRDPLAVMLACLVLVAFVAADLYLSFRCLWCLARYLLSCCCCCCRSGDGTQPTRQRSESDEPASAGKAVDAQDLETTNAFPVAIQLQEAAPKKGTEAKKSKSKTGASELSVAAAAAPAESAPVGPSSPPAPVAPTSPTSPAEGPARARKKKAKEAKAQAPETPQAAAAAPDSPPSKDRAKRTISGSNAFAALGDDSD